MTDREMAPDYETGGVVPVTTQSLEGAEFTGQCEWPCVCGHLKCVSGNSHFFGDPRLDEPSTPFCMVSGCDCKQFRPAPALPSPADSTPRDGQWTANDYGAGFWLCHGDKSFDLNRNGVEPLRNYLNAALPAPSAPPADAAARLKAIANMTDFGRFPEVYALAVGNAAPPADALREAREIAENLRQHFGNIGDINFEPGIATDAKNIVALIDKALGTSEEGAR